MFFNFLKINATNTTIRIPKIVILSIVKKVFRMDENKARMDKIITDFFCLASLKSKNNNNEEVRKKIENGA